MDEFRVHFEVFARRNARTGFVLDLATEDRVRALEWAEELLATGRALEKPAAGRMPTLRLRVESAEQIIRKGNHDLRHTTSIAR